MIDCFRQARSQPGRQGRRGRRPRPLVPSCRARPRAQCRPPTDASAGTRRRLATTARGDRDVRQGGGCDTTSPRAGRCATHPGLFRYPEQHRFEARPAQGGGYGLHENGRRRARQPDVDAAVRALFWRTHESTLDALPDFSRLQAECATLSGRRLVAAGPERSDKSTLMWPTGQTDLTCSAALPP